MTSGKAANRILRVEASVLAAIRLAATVPAGAGTRLQVGMYLGADGYVGDSTAVPAPLPRQ